MEAGKADFTQTFKSLKAILAKEDTSFFLNNFIGLNEDNQLALSKWLGDWKKLMKEN